MIHPREASLGEEARTSLKTEGSTLEVGDPRLKTEFTRGGISLIFVLFVYIIVPVEPRIITVGVISKVCLRRYWFT